MQQYINVAVPVLFCFGYGNNIGRFCFVLEHRIHYQEGLKEMLVITPTVNGSSVILDKSLQKQANKLLFIDPLFHTCV